MPVKFHLSRQIPGKFTLKKPNLNLSMDIDEDDFVFYGTPIEREEELNSRKKKAVAEASGHLRTLPSWKQEVILFVYF